MPEKNEKNRYEVGILLADFVKVLIEKHGFDQKEVVAGCMGFSIDLTSGFYNFKSPSELAAYLREMAFKAENFNNQN